MPTKARRKRERAKQGRLEGMEEPSFPEVDQASEVYYDRMKDRVALSEEEAEAKDSLIEAMKGHKLKRYEYEHDGVTKVVELTDKSNVRVKPKKEESNGDGE